MINSVNPIYLKFKIDMARNSVNALNFMTILDDARIESILYQYMKQFKKYHIFQ